MTPLALDARQTAMLAEMGVWLPPLPRAAPAITATITEQTSSQAMEVMMQAAQAPVPAPIRPRPESVRMGPAAAANVIPNFGPTFYRVTRFKAFDPIDAISDMSKQTTPPDLVVVAEALSPEAHTLLSQMLAPLKLAPEKIVVAELESARAATDGSPPFAEHAATQIGALQSACVLALGPHAVKAMLQTTAGEAVDLAEQPFSKLREARLTMPHPSQGQPISLIATFHPQQLLRTPSAKGRAWADMQHLSQAIQWRAA